MAQIRQSIWIKSSTEPQPIVNQPDFVFEIKNSNIRTFNDSFQRGLNFTTATSSNDTRFYLDVILDDANDLVPSFSMRARYNTVDEPGTISFSYDPILNDIRITYFEHFSPLGNAFTGDWNRFRTLYNNIPLSQLITFENNSKLKIRRATDLLITQGENGSNPKDTKLTFTNVAILSEPPILNSILTPVFITNDSEDHTISNVLYRQTNLVTLSSFLGGGFIPGSTRDFVIPFQGWSNTPPMDIFNTDGSIANLQDLWEIYAVFDDEVFVSPLQFIGTPYKAAEVFTNQFKDYLISIAPPGIEKVEVRTSSNRADNTIVDLIFEKTDGKTDTVQFEIPKPTTPIDIDVNITDEPININVVTEPTVIDLSVVEGNKIDIETSVTNVQFTGSDITNVDLTVEENDIALRTDSTEVIFQHQGSQGLRGTGFTLIFRRSETTPSIPNGGSFNTQTNTVTVPDFWSRSPSGTNANGTLYVSAGKLEAGNTVITWTTPTEIQGGCWRIWRFWNFI